VEYSVDEIAVLAGVSVDTIRFYQTRGILPHPERRGRRGVYGPSHVERLRLVRSMAERGLSLKAIAMLLEKDGDSSDTALLAALQEEADEPSYSSTQLAEELGIPAKLLRTIEATGLAGDAAADEAPDHSEDSETSAPSNEDSAASGSAKRRYSQSDLDAAKGALGLLGFGFPFTRLLALAVRHDRAARRTVDEAIDLFDDYVRKREGGDSESDSAEAVAKAFKQILPVVTGLVAHHFQRVLVARALKRLRKKGDNDALRVAVEVARKNQVRVRWE
jgi:hypothetical protein